MNNGGRGDSLERRRMVKGSEAMPVNPEGGLINTVEEAWGEGKSSPGQAQVGEGTTRRLSPFTHPTIHYKKSWRPLAPWGTTKYPTSCSRQTGT